ncbi:DUF1992 domain-containing protein [Rhodovulum visakhapatnamense]|uniref:Uncharacterized protein DUF1992 n=1 Tax=Rhodovulum visakhapatnamense TaxID=364297 RepID=A0A4R8G166_9RHOB|nr:DUF1992 domain-containing protein [Rhodovulum visakhapatnamense]TDX30205.1 uncharacterized protein DUF1992 [Rhodovulum visakhapatnamense]
MSWMSRLVERRILQAQARCQLQGLAGEGAPLPDRPGDAFVGAAEAAGFRIMAEAGALPEEISLKKQVLACRTRLTALTDPAERKAAMAELADLQMRQAIAEEARRRFLSF